MHEIGPELIAIHRLSLECQQIDSKSFQSHFTSGLNSKLHHMYTCRVDMWKILFDYEWKKNSWRSQGYKLNVMLCVAGCPRSGKVSRWREKHERLAGIHIECRGFNIQITEHITQHTSTAELRITFITFLFHFFWLDLIVLLNALSSSPQFRRWMKSAVEYEFFSHKSFNNHSLTLPIHLPRIAAAL